jgi:FAD:protein FMN transferase
LFLIVTGILAGCHSPVPQTLQRFAFAHPAMGTRFNITLYAANSASAEAAAQAAFDCIDKLEDIMSDYQADSELMRLCDQPAGHPVAVSADLFKVLDRAQKLAQNSHGAFDVTVGPYVRLWRLARKRKLLPTSAELATAASAVGYQKLRLDRRARTVTLLVPNMRLDLGGIAKGYAADQALRLLKTRGIDRALVAASGDMAIGNPPPGQSGWKIGITSIDAGTNRADQLMLLRNAGISTSGDTEQFIEIGGVRYSHILDRASGLGLTNRIQATVIVRDATTTDAMATSLCVLGVKKGLALVESTPVAAALILTLDGGREESFPSRRFRQISAKQAE